MSNYLPAVLRFSVQVPFPWLDMDNPSLNHNFMKTIPQQIEGCGWFMDVKATDIPGDRDHYRAEQGGFKTIWRLTPEQVLADVQLICKARKDPVNSPF